MLKQIHAAGGEVFGITIEPQTLATAAEAEYTWDKIQKALEDSEDAPLDKMPNMGGQTVSWPLFLLILTAHGWFLRPKPFPLAPGLVQIHRQFQNEPDDY